MLAQREEFGYPEEYTLPDVLAMALATHARRAFSAACCTGISPRSRPC